MTNKLGSANPNRIPKPKKKGKDTLDIYGKKKKLVNNKEKI